jgi:hypothetical protein
MGIAKSSAPTTSAIPYAAGRPIDGADVVRNPPVRGAPPRRFSFTPTVQNRLLDPGRLHIAVSARDLAEDTRLQGTRSPKGILRSRQGTYLRIAGTEIY